MKRIADPKDRLGLKHLLLGLALCFAVVGISACDGEAPPPGDEAPAPPE